MRYLPPTLLLPLTFWTLSVADASAQGDACTETVPKELAVALLFEYGLPGEAAPEILVGQAPNSFPSDALPQGAQILGSVVYSSRSKTVAIAPQTVNVALNTFKDRLLHTGWSEPQEPRGGPMPSAVAHPEWRSAQAVIAFAMLCREGSSLIVRASLRGEGESYLHVEQNQTPPPSCNRSLPYPSPLTEDPDSPLYAPE